MDAKAEVVQSDGTNPPVCDPGHGFDSQRCIECPPGTFSAGSDSICSLVPPGNLLLTYLGDAEISLKFDAIDQDITTRWLLQEMFY